MPLLSSVLAAALLAPSSSAADHSAHRLDDLLVVPVGAAKLAVLVHTTSALDYEFVVLGKKGPITISEADARAEGLLGLVSLLIDLQGFSRRYTREGAGSPEVAALAAKKLALLADRAAHAVEPAGRDEHKTHTAIGARMIPDRRGGERKVYAHFRSGTEIELVALDGNRYVTVRAEDVGYADSTDMLLAFFEIASAWSWSRPYADGALDLDFGQRRREREEIEGRPFSVLFNRAVEFKRAEAAVAEAAKRLGPPSF